MCQINKYIYLNKHTCVEAFRSLTIFSKTSMKKRNCLVKKNFSLKRANNLGKVTYWIIRILKKD